MNICALYKKCKTFLSPNNQFLLLLEVDDITPTEKDILYAPHKPFNLI